MQIDTVTPASAAAITGQLATILLAAVASGASVGFLESLTLDEAERWWQDALAAANTLTWVARDQGRVVGVVQLKLAEKANSAHRAEVAKLLVLSSAQGRGIASLLLQELERQALAIGRWLLMLDTRTGSAAEAIYLRRGWRRYGIVTDYAVDPDGTLAACSFMTKDLRSAGAARP